MLTTTTTTITINHDHHYLNHYHQSQSPQLQIKLPPMPLSLFTIASYYRNHLLHNHHHRSLYYHPLLSIIFIIIFIYWTTSSTATVKKKLRIKDLCNTTRSASETSNPLILIKWDSSRGFGVYEHHHCDCQTLKPISLAPLPYNIIICAYNYLSYILIYLNFIFINFLMKKIINIPMLRKQILLCWKPSNWYRPIIDELDHGRWFQNNPFGMEVWKMFFNFFMVSSSICLENIFSRKKKFLMMRKITSLMEVEKQVS